MIRSLKKAFVSYPSVNLEVIKNSQILTGGIHSFFLANRSNHPEAVYPVTTNSTLHLHPGNQLTIQSFTKSLDGNRTTGILVTRISDGMIFQIFSSDLKRFIKIA